MHILHQFAVPGGLFVLTLVFGFWLSRLCKPYNGVLFNVHKLIALSAAVVTAIQMAKLLRGMETQALVIVLLVVAALCVIALFFSGASMSAGKFDRSEDACPLQNDVPLIHAKMDAADGLLPASPVYVDDVSGLVKNWE